MSAFALGVMSLFASSCGSDEPGSSGSSPGGGVDESVEDSFVAGADVSWLTQLEYEGVKFYSRTGSEMECMQLLRDECGIKAIRLRVWVNPVDGWNGTEDVLAKSRRANALGLDLMIDFHFRDTWADPSQQDVPAVWASLDIDGLKYAVSNHVKAVLGGLKSAGITPKWVQIGNETPDGMLFPLGNATNHPENYASLVTAGYDAVKSVFPDAKVIVHVDQGNNEGRFTWLFDILKSHNAKYDMIGMSLYPEPSSSWRAFADDCIANAVELKSRYGKPVMICEVGMPYNEPDQAYGLIKHLKDEGQSRGVFEGIFYWEPEAPAGYNGGYSKGCFDNGRPTHALDAFK